MVEIEKINSADTMIKIDHATKQIETGEFKNILEKAMDEGNIIKLKEACQQFEQYFTSMMYKSMKKTIVKSDIVPESTGREYAQSLLDDKLMEEASSAGGLGVGDMLYKQLYSQMENRYSSK